MLQNFLDQFQLLFQSEYNNLIWVQVRHKILRLDKPEKNYGLSDLKL